MQKTMEQKVFARAADILRPRGRWYQGGYGVFSDGNRIWCARDIDGNLKRIKSLCLTGALRAAAYELTSHDLVSYTRLALSCQQMLNEEVKRQQRAKREYGRLGGVFTGIVGWQDWGKRKKKAVIGLLEKFANTPAVKAV